MSSTITAYAFPQNAENNRSSATTKSAFVRRWSRRVAVDVVMGIDALAIIIGALLPMAIYAEFGGIEPNWVLTVQSGFAAAVIAVLLLKNWGMYDQTRLHDFPENPGRLLIALLITLTLVLGIGLPYAITDAHVWVWYAAWASASYTFLLMNRGLSRLTLKRLTAAGRFDERVAVYGAGQIARRVHDHLKHQPMGIHFVGVFDDRAGEERINPEGLEIAGRLNDLIDAGRSESVDKIIVALPQAAEGRMNMIARKLEQLPVSVHIVTHISSDLVEDNPTHKVSNVGSVGLLDIKRKPLSDWQPVIKRAEDVVVGATLLLASAVLFPIIAAAIKLESRGPVFFVQRRRGLNKQDIDVLKFRTMHVLEDGDVIEQATRNDSRVTGVGRILRRFSLDELPQLINVLRGEMSLVGPRPHAISHDDQFGHDLEEYANRHQVKPGITGLAQIKGCRGQTATTDDVAERVAHDIAYIQDWSLMLDLKILIRTIWVVVTGRNAY
ncbi:MAG: undecaprenyl-phosphate glucose phosphotransferase [Pseudomonadota bacterium]